MPFVKRLNTREADEALAELHEIGQECARLEDKLANATQRRDELVASASRMGATRRAVANAAGITAARVQQILNRAGPR